MDENRAIAERIIKEQLLVVYKDQSILIKSLQMGLSKQSLKPVDKKILYKHYTVYIQYARVVTGNSFYRMTLDEYWDVVKDYADKKKFVVTDDDIIVY